MRFKKTGFFGAESPEGSSQGIVLQRDQRAVASKMSPMKPMHDGLIEFFISELNT